MRPYVLLVATIIGLIAFFIFGPSTCTRPNQTRRVLEAQGYTEVQITGWRLFAGDRGDLFSTGFRAKAPNGTQVTGAVTSGAFKGNTVRLD